MIAFDADVMSELFHGVAAYTSRANAIPADQQSIPIVTVEEMIRGRLSVVRQAEAGRGRIRIERAYELFQRTVTYVQEFHVLAYTTAADKLYQDWRDEKIRIGTHDLRIAAIAVAHSVTLISRNRRDYDLVPNLDVEYWG